MERAIRYVRESFFAARPFTTLEDFNRQAARWRDEIAHCRPWPGDASQTVQEVFENERAYLLPLPRHPFETDPVTTVSSRRTIYVRFDLNDYSIRPDAVGHPLTLVASDTRVRIFQGQGQDRGQVADHIRSWDRGRLVSDPDHEEALLQEKRRALGSTAGGRLAAAVPESEVFLETAFQRGESAARQTVQLQRLLEEYGAAELQAAIREALERDTPRVSSGCELVLKRQAAIEDGTFYEEYFSWSVAMDRPHASEYELQGVPRFADCFLNFESSDPFFVRVLFSEAWHTILEMRSHD